MAHVAIREYDAKKLLHASLGTPYSGVLIRTEEDFRLISEEGRYVAKPDQLFGKRAKRGLVGVNLSKAETVSWIRERFGQETDEDGIRGTLDTFLVEPFVPHEGEWYASIESERDADIITLSAAGGIDIESQWDTAKHARIDVDRVPTAAELANELGVTDPRIADFLVRFLAFFREYGFVSYEINPFVFDPSGNVCCLDSVARVDSCEEYRQNARWGTLEFPASFGSVSTEAERFVADLDSRTGASLKLTILDPDANIWLLTSGGGGSVIIADTLADRGFARAIGNYGECSGNPDRENTREYTRTLLECALASRSEARKYLVIAGAIANFTYIDKTFAGVVDAFKIHQETIRAQNIKILVRRGGPNDTVGLKNLKDACEAM